MNACRGILEEVTPELVAVACERLPTQYIDALREKPHFAESLVARFLVYTDLGYLPEFDESGKPVFHNGEFWSISHKPGFVYIGYGEPGKRVGVDLEVATTRDTAVMNVHTGAEYAELWGKNWENFYLLWTLKESVVKCFSGWLDDFPDIAIGTVSGKYTMYIVQNTDWSEELTEYFPTGTEIPPWGVFFKYTRKLTGIFRWMNWTAEISVQKNGLVYAETREI